MVNTSCNTLLTLPSIWKAFERIGGVNYTLTPVVCVKIKR